jgi:asparagine synthase (glutamine-hydrolysing)
MGRFAAILSRRGQDVSGSIIRMLRAGTPPATDAEGIAIGEDTFIKGRIEPPDLPETSIALGYALNKVHPEDPPQPLAQHGYSFAIEGRLWSEAGKPTALSAGDALGKDPGESLSRLVMEGNGPFAITAQYNRTILGGRDSIGTIPLYHGENEDIAAIASSMKMLWAIGLEAQNLRPGWVLKISEGGTSTEPVKVLAQPHIKEITLNEAASELDKLMTDAVASRTRGLSQASLGFSGGIDSSILAHYLNKAGVDLDLICVGLEGSREFETAETAAESLDLPLRLEAFTAEDVKNDLEGVLWSIEEPNPMKVSVAVPLNWAARSAAEYGSRVFFSGNGSDELFGGYHRHAQEYAEHGEAVVASIFRDVSESYRVNYERDHKVCMDAGLELRLPFADLALIEWGLSIPPNLKLSGGPGSPRKIVLRSLARRLGLPEDIAVRPKKAIQYSTGVNSALRKLAKREGKTLRDYLSERFQKLKDENLRRLG